MISWDEVKRKAKAHPGQFVDWDDTPLNTPRKRIDQCFIVNDICWIVVITDRSTGEVHELETANATVERNFKRDYKDRFMWD